MCSFCLRSATEVNKLIAGPGIYICDECVGKCVDILAQPTSTEAQLAVNVWDGLSQDDMLNKIPRISAVAEQVERSMNEWVAELRRRGVTWAKVGGALQMSRQSAWTRFSGDS